MFGWDFSALRVTAWMLCSKSCTFEHELDTRSALPVYMGALICHCLEAVQTRRHGRFADQNSRWLKDTTHWPLLQPVAAAWNDFLELLPLLKLEKSLCQCWWGYCASEQSTSLVCTLQRKGRNDLWLNRAFRYPFQITTVASFSYAGFKLKVNKNNHTSTSPEAHLLLFRWLTKASQKIPPCLTKSAGTLGNWLAACSYINTIAIILNQSCSYSKCVL